MTNATTKFLAALFTLVLFAGAAYGQAVEPDSTRRAAWQQFQQEHGPGWTMRWNEKTGTPSTLRPSSAAARSAKSYAGPPAQAARSFLSENRHLFGMKAGLANLKLAGVRRLGKVDHVRFQQVHDGVPVYEAEYLVHLRSDGRVTMANGTHYPAIDAPTTPTVSEAAAQQTALSDLKGEPARSEITRELLIYPDEGKFHLAWKLTIPTKPFGGWVYFVDAQSGTVLENYSQLTDVVGDGKVYPKHPDNSSVTVKDLYRLDGTGTLSGTYADVVNDDGSEAYSSSHSFQYSTSNTHFDEVNLYYHVDKFRSNFINGLEDANNSLGFTQITAHAHSFDPVFGDLNAWFDRGDREIYFGDAASSSSYNNFAREDKVIYHEYGHAVIYDFNSGIRSNCQEEGAISEGVPDYFAGAHTGRSVIGDYVGIVRNMANPGLGSYVAYQKADDDYPGICPSGGVEPHDGGEFFSAVLWDLRNASGINPGEADYLVFAALSYLDSSPDFHEFRSAVLSEDGAKYSGAHTSTIKSVFDNWGIGPLEITISGPTQVQTQSYPSWSVQVTGGELPYTIDWYDWVYYPNRGAPDKTESGMTGYYSRYVGDPTYDYFFIQASVSDGTSSTDATQTLQVQVVGGSGPTMASSSAATCPAGQICQARAAGASPSLKEALPQEFSLEGNAPNPARSQTTIRFGLPGAVSGVEITVVDIAGRVVERLSSDKVGAGRHRATLDVSDLSSGVYLYRLQAGQKYAGTGKIVVVR